MSSKPNLSFNYKKLKIGDERQENKYLAAVVGQKVFGFLRMIIA